MRLKIFDFKILLNNLYKRKSALAKDNLELELRLLEIKMQFDAVIRGIKHSPKLLNNENKENIELSDEESKFADEQMQRLILERERNG